MRLTFLQIREKIWNHELVSGTAYYFVGSMVGNVFAFLFNFFVAHKLTTVDYGIYASLLSFFSLSILIPQSLLGTIVQFATKYFSKKQYAQAQTLYWKTIQFLFFLGILVLFSITIFAHSIGSFLHVGNITLIIGVGILIIANFISTMNISYLQSSLQFGFTSAIQAVGAGSKLLVGIILVLIGFGIPGALIGILFSFLVPFFLAFFRLNFLFRSGKKSVKIPVKEIVVYALPSMVTVIALSSFISSDVILAKHFLSNENAGLYAGLSLVGRVIFYFTSIIPTVMFPVIINKFNKGKAVHNTFFLGLLLVSIPSFGLTLFYFLFPHFVLSIFLGRKEYISASTSLGIMGIFLSLYSIITVMVNFFLSLKQTKVFIPVLVFALIQITGIEFFHKSIYEIIFVSIISVSLLCATLCVYFLYHHKIKNTYTISTITPQEV